jgi:hypothetical protein
MHPANCFGRHEFADVWFWVSLASYSCSLGGFANGNCPLPYRTYKFRRCARSVAAHRFIGIYQFTVT